MIDNVSHDNALLLEAAQKYAIHPLGQIRVNIVLEDFLKKQNHIIKIPVVTIHFFYDLFVL